jgi:single-stranded DNA-binding protein
MSGINISFEGNLAADLNVRQNRDGGTYADAVVLVNQGPDRPPTRWNVRIAGRTAENLTGLGKGDRLIVVGTVVTDSWADKDSNETRYALKVLAQSVGVSLTFARVTGLERNATKRDQAPASNE